MELVNLLKIFLVFVNFYFIGIKTCKSTLSSSNLEILSRFKRQLLNPQLFPGPPGDLNVPIPTMIGFFPGSRPAADNCRRDEVIVNNSCASALSRGPCAFDELVFLDPDTNQGFCASRLCNPDRVFVFSNQLCYDPWDVTVCPPGRRLFTSAFGTPVCACPDGTIEDDDDLDDDVCAPLFGKNLQCATNQVFGITGLTSPPGCVNDPCGSQNLNRLPTELPFVPSVDTMQCFKIGSSQGVCPANTWYTLSLSIAKGECLSLEEAGYDVYTDDEVSAFNSIFSKNIDRGSSIALGPQTQDIQSNLIPQTPPGTKPIAPPVQTVVTNDIIPSQGDINSPQGKTNPLQGKTNPPQGNSNGEFDNIISNPNQQLEPTDNVQPIPGPNERRMNEISVNTGKFTNILNPVNGFTKDGVSSAQAGPSQLTNNIPKNMLNKTPIQKQVGIFNTGVSLESTNILTTNTNHPRKPHNPHVKISSIVPARLAWHKTTLPSGEMQLHQHDSSSTHRFGHQFSMSEDFIDSILLALRSRRKRRFALPHSSPGSIFQSSLVSCRPGEARDINAKCRDKQLPSHTTSRPPRTVAPSPPRRKCPTGQSYGRNRRCTSNSNAQVSLASILG